MNIGVDGGVYCDNIDVVAQAGANVIISGSGIFKHPNPKDAIKIMRDSIEKYIPKQPQNLLMLL